MLLLTVGIDLLIQLKLAMDELEELRACEEDRHVEALLHVVTTPVLGGKGLAALILSNLLTVDFAFIAAHVGSALNNVSLALEELLLSNPEPLLDSAAICPEILHLLYLQDDSDVELVQLRHFLFLEVSYLILGLCEVLINVLLFVFQTFLCVLKLADIDLNLLFAVIELQALVTQSLDFINLGVLTKLRVEVVIVVVIIFLFNLFFLGLLAVFVTFAIFLLYLLRSASLLRDLLIEGQDLVVVLMVRTDTLMELLEQLRFVVLDLLDILSILDQLARDVLDLLDNEALLLGALLELA